MVLSYVSLRGKNVVFWIALNTDISWMASVVNILLSIFPEIPYRVLIFPVQKTSGATTTANCWFSLAGQLRETSRIPISKHTLDISIQVGWGNLWGIFRLLWSVDLMEMTWIHQRNVIHKICTILYHDSSTPSAYYWFFFWHLHIIWPTLMFDLKIHVEFLALHTRYLKLDILKQSRKYNYVTCSDQSSIIRLTFGDNFVWIDLNTVAVIMKIFDRTHTSLKVQCLEWTSWS